MCSILHKNVNKKVSLKVICHPTNRGQATASPVIRGCNFTPARPYGRSQSWMVSSHPLEARRSLPNCAALL